VSVAENGGIVPAHFWFEVLYNVEKFARRTSLDPGRLDDFLMSLSSLPITIDTSRSATQMLDLRDIARSHDLNIFDAGYLELAVRERFSLITRDTRLGKAALAAGVSLFRA